MNLSGVIPPGGSLALIVKYATHPRQTQQQGYTKSNDNDQELYAKFGMLKLQYSSSNSPPPQSYYPTTRDQNYSSTSTGYTPFPGKVDQYLQTKPRSSDWIDSYPQPHSPPTLSESPPPPPLSSISSYSTIVTVSGVPPSLDIMDFHFLSKYGRVLEGKMMTRDVQVISSDGVPMNYQTSSGMIEFFVNVNSLTSYNHLLSLNDSLVVVEGHSIMVRPLSPGAPHP